MTATVLRDRANKQLVVRRAVRGTPALIWACWTEPEHLRQWWGPLGWRSDILGLDLRPGGVWRYRLRPDRDHELAEEHWGRAVYETVDPPTHLTFLDGVSTPDGTPVPGTDQPTSVSIRDLAPDDGDRRCEVDIVVRFPSVQALEQAEPIGMVDGFTETLDRLDAYTPGAAREADR